MWVCACVCVCVCVVVESVGFILLTLLQGGKVCVYMFYVACVFVNVCYVH
jgi:hypothetical protein